MSENTYVLTSGSVTAVDMLGGDEAGQCVVMSLTLEVKGKPEVSTDLKIMVDPSYALRLSELLTGAVTACLSREVPN